MNGQSQHKLEISLQLTGGDRIEGGDIDNMARLLRDEIEACPGTDGVKLKPADHPPAGSKAVGEAVTIGAILLAVLPAAAPSLIDYVKEWTLRPGNIPIKIKAQVGNRNIEAEFDPRVTNKDDVVALVREIQALLEPKARE